MKSWCNQEGKPCSMANKYGDCQVTACCNTSKPTVKAIPIDFIKAFSEILLDRRERFVLETLIEVWEGKRETKVPYINQMLDDWEKENATEVND